MDICIQFIKSNSQVKQLILWVMYQNEMIRFPALAPWQWHLGGKIGSWYLQVWELSMTRDKRGPIALVTVEHTFLKSPLLIQWNTIKNHWLTTWSSSLIRKNWPALHYCIITGTMVPAETATVHICGTMIYIKINQYSYNSTYIYKISSPASRI